MLENDEVSRETERNVSVRPESRKERKAKFSKGRADFMLQRWVYYHKVNDFDEIERIEKLVLALKARDFQLRITSKNQPDTWRKPSFSTLCRYALSQTIPKLQARVADHDYRARLKDSEEEGGE